MRSILVVTILLSVPALAPAQPPAQPACDSEEHRQFDFWIGEWEVTSNDQVAGTNSIESTLNGCVLTEHWIGSSGSEGRSFNMFYSRDGHWRQTWVDNAGTRLDVSGGLDERGRMVLSGTMPGADGAPVLHEISWTPNADGTVVQHWRASRDAGKSWQDLFVGTYARK